ncbi:hypothetical protein D3C72_1873210 [compost metagenome]
MQVFAVDQGQEVRVLQVVLPGEGHQLGDRLDRGQLFELELAFGLADVLVGRFEHGLEQPLFVAEVLIDHAFVGLGAQRDAVDACATQPQLGEFDLGGIEDSQAGRIGVTGGARGGLFFGFSGHVKRSPELGYCSS